MRTTALASRRRWYSDRPVGLKILAAVAIASLTAVMLCGLAV